MWRSGDARVACPSSNAERGATGRPTDLLELDWTDRPNGDCRMRRRRRRHPQHFCSNSNSADFLPSLPTSLPPSSLQHSPCFCLRCTSLHSSQVRRLVVCSSVRSYRRRDAAAASFGASPLPVPALPLCLQRILIRTSYFTGRIVSAATAAAAAVCSAYRELTVRRETGANVVVFPR